MARDLFDEEEEASDEEKERKGWGKAFHCVLLNFVQSEAISPIEIPSERDEEFRILRNSLLLTFQKEDPGSLAS